MTGRRAAIALALFAALCLALGAGFLALVRTSWFRDKVRQRLIAEVERATGGRAEIGSFYFDGGRMRAEIREFVLHGTEARNQAPFLRARRIAVGFKIVSLIKRNIDLRLLEVEAPRLRIAVYPDGTTNIPRPRPPRPGGPNAVERFLALAIDRVEILQGAIECGIQKANFDFHGESLRVQLFYEAAHEQYAGRISVRRAAFNAPAAFTAPLQIDATVQLEKDRLRICSAQVITAKSSLQFRGVLANWRSPHFDADFSAKLSVAELAGLYPLPVAPAGSATLEGSLHYDSSGGWQVRSTVAALGLAYRRAPVSVSGINLNAIVDWTPGRLNVTRFMAAALGGSLQGVASLTSQQGLRLDGHLHALPLDGAFAALDLPSPPWQGSISGQIQLRARPDLEAPALEARLTLAGAALGGHLDLRYDGLRRRFTLGTSHIQTAVSRIDLDGDPDASLRVRLDTTDLRELEATLAILGASSAHQMPLTLRDGSARFEGQVSGGLRSPHIRGAVTLRNAQYRGYTIHRMEAAVEVNASQARIDRLAIEGSGIQASGSARIPLRDFQLDSSMPVSATLKAAGDDLAALLPGQAAGLGLSGSARARVRIEGSLGAPAAQGEMELSKVCIAGQRLDKVRATVYYARNRLTISQAQASAGGAPIQWTAAYAHKPGDWRQGAAHLKLAAAGVPLQQIAALKSVFPGSAGRLNAQLETHVEIGARGVHILELAGQAETLDLALGGRSLGWLRAGAVTSGSAVVIRSQAELAGAGVSMLLRMGLDAPHPVEGELQFRRLALSTIHTWYAGGGGALPLEAFSEGKLAFRGQGVDPLKWKSRADIGVLVINPGPGAAGSMLG